MEILLGEAQTKGNKNLILNAETRFAYNLF